MPAQVADLEGWKPGFELFPCPHKGRKEGKIKHSILLEKQQQSSCTDAISDSSTAVKVPKGHCFTFKQEKSEDIREIQGLEKCFILDSKDPSHRFLRNRSVKYQVYIVAKPSYL